jgi:hypothetical protein
LSLDERFPYPNLKLGEFLPVSRGIKTSLHGAYKSEPSIEADLDMLRRTQHVAANLRPGVIRVEA